MTILVIFLGLFFFRPVEDGDIWWHLKAGEYIAQEKQVPSIDPFPFQNEQTPWILTQWLGSLFYYLVYAVSGLLGLQIIRVIIFLSIMLIFALYCRRKLPFPILIVLLYTLALALDTRCLLRPFVFNFIFIQIFLISLFKHQESSKWKDLWMIPASGILWVNLHLGSFMYGTLLIAIFLLSSFISYIQIRRKMMSETQLWVKASDRFKNLTILFFIYCGIFLINPYGIDGALHPIKAIIFNDYLSFHKISNSIAELLPPQNLFSYKYIWFFAGLIFFITSIFSGTKHRLTKLLLFIFSLFLFFYGRRAGVFFVLCSLYSFVNFDDAFEIKSYQKIPLAANFMDKILMSIMIIIMLYNIQFMMNQKFYINETVYDQFSLREKQFNPTRIKDLLRNEQLGGAIFNDDRYGGYILWHHYPQIKPFVDNRQINYAPIDLYHAVRRNPSKNWEILEKQFQFKLALLDASKPINGRLIQFFIEHKDWSIIAVDGFAVLFAKTNEIPLSEELRNYENNLIVENQDPYDISKRFPPLSEEPKSSFLDIDYIYIDHAAKGMTLFELGYKGVGLRTLLKAFDIADNQELRSIFTSMMMNLADIDDINDDELIKTD